MSEKNGKRPATHNGHAAVSLDSPQISKCGGTDQIIISVLVNDPTKQDESGVADEVVRYVTAPESELILGDPSLLTRKQKQARKGLPTPENLRKLARV